MPAQADSQTGTLNRLAQLVPRSIRRNRILRASLKYLYAKGLYRLLNLHKYELLERPEPGQAIFVDVSSITAYDHHTGIQRVTRNLYLALSRRKRIVPIWTSLKKSGWHLAKAVTDGRNLAFMPTASPVRMKSGDIFLGLDFSPLTILARLSSLRAMRAKGIKAYFILHDLIPLLHPHFFPAGTAVVHKSWLKEAARIGGLICVSRQVAQETSQWLLARHLPEPPQGIHWFHHGVSAQDFRTSILDKKVELPACPYFLVVSTIEPRKGHGQTLDAFERLWAQGYSCGLVLVGKKGWKTDSLCQRIKIHPQKDTLLFWHEHCCDGALADLYKNALCVLMPSQAEGFGLALIEGAFWGRPLLLRDLPVFREIAQDKAAYFKGGAEQLAQAIRQWLEHEKKGLVAKPDFHVQSWDESAAQILTILNCDS